VSSTVKRRRPGPRRTPQQHAAVSVNFTALPAKLSRIWRRRPSSARIEPTRRRGPGDLQALSRGPAATAARDAAQQASTSIGAGCSSTAGAQLGEVQHVVDQGQQVLAAVAQRRDIGLLLGREPRAVQ
jgi:hypothetical protein